MNRSGIFDFDLSLVNPTGFGAFAPDRGLARLAHDGLEWKVTDEFTEPRTIDTAAGVQPADLTEFRRYTALQIDWASHTGDEAILRFLAALASAGVPLFSFGPVPTWAAPLGDDLLGHFERIQAEDLTDPLQRELYSIRQRRSALAARTRESNRTLPSVTAMICTCRPEYVESALETVRRQRYPNVETVLLLHGVSRKEPTIREALAKATNPVTVREVPEDTVFGDALNQGVKAASGDYVTKIDDDDWYGPNHIGDLMNAAWYSGAAIVGGFTEFVHLDELDTTIYRSAGGGEKYSTFVAGGTITASRETMRELGGFPSLPRAIDVGLFERAREAEAPIYRGHGMEYLFSRRSEGHTWDVGVAYFLKSAERQWFKDPFDEHVVADSLEQCLVRRKDPR